jgi:hypothetical protein
MLRAYHLLGVVPAWLAFGLELLLLPVLLALPLVSRDTPRRGAVL